MTSAPYLVELDDDVVDAPAGWDAMLLDAFKRLPSIGFLAADLEDDPHDLASRYRHHIRPHEYEPVEENGVRLLRGPAGGGCAITSRELNERVGGFRQDKKRVFWLEDEAYIGDIARLGYGSAVLADLRVHHTGGPHYTKDEGEGRVLAAVRQETRATSSVKRGSTTPLFPASTSAAAVRAACVSHPMRVLYSFPHREAGNLDHGLPPDSQLIRAGIELDVVCTSRSHSRSQSDGGDAAAGGSACPIARWASSAPTRTTTIGRLESSSECADIDLV